MENYEFEDDEESGLQTLYHVFPYTRAASDLRSADYTTSCILFATRPGRKTVLLYAEAGKKLPRELDELASKVNSAAVNVTAKLTKSDSLPSFVSQLASILIDVEAYQVSGTVAVEEAYEGLLSLDDLTKGANNAYTSIKNAVQVVDKEGGSVRLLSSGAFDSTMIFAKRSAVTMNAEQTVGTCWVTGDEATFELKVFSHDSALHELPRHRTVIAIGVHFCTAYSVKNGPVKPLASFCVNSSTFMLPIVGKDEFATQTLLNWELLPRYEHAPDNMILVRIWKVDTVHKTHAGSRQVVVMMTSGKALNRTAVKLTSPLSERLLALQEVDAFQTNSNEWLDNEDNTWFFCEKYKSDMARAPLISALVRAPPPVASAGGPDVTPTKRPHRMAAGGHVGARAAVQNAIASLQAVDELDLF